MCVALWPEIIGHSVCIDGRLAVLSDADSSSLQLVEMCQSQSVWSPLCDSDWTQQDATVVCRELGYQGHSVNHTYNSSSHYHLLPLVSLYVHYKVNEKSCRLRMGAYRDGVKRKRDKIGMGL